MTLTERQKIYLETLRAIPTPQQRFNWLVEASRRRLLFPESDRVDSNRVEGCPIRIWFVPEFRDERCWFRLDSDAVSLKAVGGVLCDFYSGSSADEILTISPELLNELGLAQNLAESRRRTVWRVREKIMDFARLHRNPQATLGHA